MHILYENEVLKYPQQSPPRWVIGIGQLCRLTVPAGPITHRGGRHTAIWLRVYDPIFVVFGRTWPLFKNIESLEFWKKIGQFSVAHDPFGPELHQNNQEQGDYHPF